MLHSRRKWLVGLALGGGLVAGGWFFWVAGRGQQGEAKDEMDAPLAEVDAHAHKVVVSDQAQGNLRLTAKALKAGVFWKTITVQGMVVDRPGVSDREIAAPAVGIVSQILHVPGDVVGPGDVLFTLKLASESLNQTQADLFKTSQEIKLAVTRRKRLEAGGGGIAQSRLIEAESEIARLEVAVKANRQELLGRGLSDDDIDGIANGKLLSEISVAVPQPVVSGERLGDGRPAKFTPSAVTDWSPTYEVQELKAELGEHVAAGQTLCHLSNHQSLAIEGRAFRDETALLERSIKEGWPVEVDFQESVDADWPPQDQTLTIRYIANTIDPVTRTFTFLLPLENQSKTVERGDRTQRLWRFRPGQKVRLHVRVEELHDVFVLPADAVVMESAEAFVFTQNANTFVRKSVRILFRDRDRVVLANDGSLPTYLRGQDRWTIAAVARTAAAQLNRMSKAGTSGVPKGFHIHADGSLHKNEDEGK